jgi:hypothetical protein
MIRHHHLLWNIVAIASGAWCITAANIATAQPINLISNGGFETPVLPADTFLNLTPASGPFGGWSISSGDVDIVRLPLSTQGIGFNAFEGDQVLDLHGLVPGAIFQEFATTVGALYRLDIRLADNPNASGVAAASIEVKSVPAGASLIAGSAAHSTSTSTNANYTSFGGMFTAQSDITRLSITSTSSNTGASGGLFLDAVSVEFVPEPAGLAVAAVAAIGMAGLRRWRR